MEGTSFNWPKTTCFVFKVFIIFWDKHSDLVHWEDLKGVGGEGGGWGDWDGEHM